MPEHSKRSHDVSRRTVLWGAAVGGSAVPVLAACGGDGTEKPGAGQNDAGTTVATADVPVQGGTILAEEKVVVTQPQEGEFKAFSAVCTHQGCTVQTIKDGRINCPCHGSAFSVEDGSVLGGPATKPLEELSASVDSGQVTVG
jgi:Rieske Fe-S protein